MTKIVLNSGDTDAVVPVSGTRYAIDALNLTVTKPWHPWSDDADEVSQFYLKLSLFGVHLSNLSPKWQSLSFMRSFGSHKMRLLMIPFDYPSHVVILLIYEIFQLTQNETYHDPI